MSTGLLGACSLDIQMSSKSLSSESLDLDVFFKDCFDSSGMSATCAQGLNVSSEATPGSPLLSLNVTTSPLQASVNFKAYVTCKPDASVAVEVLSYTDPLGTAVNSTPEYSQTSVCPPTGQLNLVFTTSTAACKDIDPTTIACLLKVTAEQNGSHDTEYLWVSESGT